MLKPLIPLVFAAVLPLSCAPPQPLDTATPTIPAEAATDSAALHALFDDEWRGRLARQPLFASHQGVADYNDLLPDVSPAAQQRYLEEDREFMARLAEIDREALSAADRTNRDLFAFIVGYRLKLAEYRPYRIPILSDDGFHMSVQRMHESVPLATVADYEQYLARLRAMGTYFDQNIGNMRPASTTDSLSRGRFSKASCLRYPEPSSKTRKKVFSMRRSAVFPAISTRRQPAACAKRAARRSWEPSFPPTSAS